MEPIRREINPEVRTLDAKAGICEYIASDESTDADREVVRANGWKFARFQRNAPFLDSHTKGSIGAMLGKVIDFKVASGQLVETVQWAIDVASNTLARVGWDMTQAGYLKAVSVGFLPEVLVTALREEDWPGCWSGVQVISALAKSGRDVWAAQLRELGLSPRNAPDTIYLAQQQIELSCCVVGCNPNALRKSYRAGILTDSIVNTIASQHPEFAGNVEKALHQGGRRYSFSKSFAQRFAALTGQTKSDDKPAPVEESAAPSITITLAEYQPFLEFLFRKVEAGEISLTDVDYFRNHIIDGTRLREDKTFTVEVPAKFAALWNEFSGSEASTVQTNNNNQPEKSPMKQKNFLDQIRQLTRPARAAFDDIETARHNGTDAELVLALRKALNFQGRERRHAFGDPVWKYLEANPEQALLWSGMARKFCGGRVTPEEAEVLSNIKGHMLNGYTVKDAAVSAGIVPGDSMGVGLFPIPVSPEFHESVFTYSAFRDLGVRVMLGQYTKFVKVTGVPSGVVISPTYQGKVVIPADATMNGEDAPEDICNTAAILLEISDEWAKDPTLDVAYGVLSLVGKGLGKMLDFVAFMSNGVDDLTSAWQTGIFMNAAVPQVSCPTIGTTNIKALTRDDFLLAVAAVAPAALQQPCRWYLHPAFIPDLLRLRDGQGDTYLLRSPAQTDSGEWELIGFPVTWVAVAPTLQQAGQKFAIFGQPSAYTCALRNEMEVMRSQDGSAFTRNQNNLRAIQRHKFVMMDAAWFSILKFAAQ